jgi:hypothetical protein
MARNVILSALGFCGGSTTIIDALIATWEEGCLQSHHNAFFSTFFPRYHQCIDDDGGVIAGLTVIIADMEYRLNQFLD